MYLLQIKIDPFLKESKTVLNSKHFNYFPHKSDILSRDVDNQKVHKEI